MPRPAMPRPATTLPEAAAPATAPLATPPRTRRPARPASWTAVAVYAVGVLSLSVVGGLAIASDETGGAGIGALLFILSPTLMAVGLRWLGREGWADAGLRLGTSRAWYAGVLIVPAALAAALLVGGLAGGVTLAPDGARRFAALLATGFVARMLFSLFEEVGWRGYLEPRLAALGVRGLQRHLAVGALWAAWHVPYVVALGEAYTPLPLAVQLPLFVVACLAMAVIWGVLRERTGSVWPAVIGHGLANALAFPLLDADVVRIDDVLLFAARPEGLVSLACLLGAAVTLTRRGQATVSRNSAGEGRRRTQ